MDTDNLVIDVYEIDLRTKKRRKTLRDAENALPQMANA